MIGKILLIILGLGFLPYLNEVEANSYFIKEIFYTSHGRMDMSIINSRHCHFASQVDNFCMLADVNFYIN